MDNKAELEKSEFNRLKDFFELISEAYQPTEFRSNVKLWGAGVLALTLWILLGSLAWTHLQSSREFAQKLSELEQPSEEKISLIEKSTGMVDSTADRLYTFLTPIVTAVTGYFFVASSSRPRESLSNQSNPKSKN